MRNRRRSNRGIVLLVVLSLLVLFVVLAVTFVAVSGQYRRAAVSQARYRRTGEDPRKLFDVALKQLIRDTTNQRSSLLGQSLLRDMYDTDSVQGVVVSAAEQAGGQFALLRFRPERGQTIPTADDYFNGRVLTILDTMWHPGFGNAWGVPGSDDDGINGTDDIGEAGWAGSDDQLTHGHRWIPKVPTSAAAAAWGFPGTDDNQDGIVDDLWEAGWVGSDDLFLSGSFHAGIGHMVHPGYDGQWGNAGFDDNGINGIDDSGEAGWPGSDDGYTAAPRTSVRIVDSGFDPAPGSGSLGVMAGAHYWVRVEAFKGAISTRLLPTAGTRLVINGAPFNGTGIGFQDRKDPLGDSTNIAAYLPLTIGSDGAWGASGWDDNMDSTPEDPGEAGWLTAADPVWPAFPTSRGGDDNVLPVALAPHISKYNAMPFGPTADPFIGGADESWDAPDFQNMFMAMVPGDTSSSATPYIIPSFHRPALINYLYSASSGSGAFSGMWTHPTLGPKIRSAVVMRPMPWDHPNFTGSNPWFDGSAYSVAVLTSHLAGIDSSGSAINPWDVDNDGDAVPDSIWIDIGLPLQTTPDGRRYKPLVAILCKDLDGRLNLNFHGAAGQLAAANRTTSAVPTSGTAPFAGAAPTSLTNLSRGQGYGPAEISVEHVVSTQYGSLISQRHRGTSSDNSPGIPYQAANPLALPPTPRIDDPFSNIKHQVIPTNNPTWVGSLVNPYGSPPDMQGRSVTALDYFGQPMVFNTGSDDERGDNPYQLSSSDASLGSVDSRFTDAELERILRWYDLDGVAMTDRLRQSASTAFGTALAHSLVTSRSSHLPVPNVMLSPDQFDGSSSSLSYVFPNPTILDLYLTKLLATDPNAALRQIVPFELRHGGLFNVNRPWANGVDDNGNQIVDEPGEGDGVDNNIDGTVDEPLELQPNGIDDDGDGLTDEADEYAKNGIDDDGDGFTDEADEFASGVPRAWNATGLVAYNNIPFNAKNDDTNPTLLAGQERQIYARHLYCLLMALKPDAANINFDGDTTNDSPAETATGLAQWAINVVDFRDSDSIMTPFEFDSNPFNADGWDADIDGDPATDESTGSAPDRLLVWGCERPELLITESLVFHDRRTEDLASPGMTVASGDPNFDQRLQPQGSVFLEVFNPWTSGALKPPAEFFYDHNPASGAASWSNGVLLNKVNPGGSPVWRMAIVKGANRFLDPDTDAPTIDRTIYFVSRTDSRITSWPTAVGTEKQYTNSGTAAPLKPGRYAIIGGRPLTMVGRRTTAIEGDSTTLEVAMTRRIRLTPNLDPEVNQVQVLSNGAITTYTSPEVQPAIGIVVGNAIDGMTEVPRPLSVTEPKPGYTLSGWDPTLAGGEGAYAPPIDTPLDTAADLLNNDTVFDYCRVHLQRLANPMLPWNPMPGEPGYNPAFSVNPYFTIDTSSVDMTAFNGVTDDAADPAVMPPSQAYFKSFQRGYDDPALAAGTSPKLRNLWKQPAVTPPGTPKTPDAPGGDHYFSFDLENTFGFLNEGFQPLFIGGSGAMADAPSLAYAGAPNSTGADNNAFPWLVWNNRPFVSPHEVLLVPRGRSSRLLGTSGFTMASSAAENYATPGAVYNHLLNFFQQTSGTVPANLHRIFDYLEVPSPYLGAEKWFNPATFTQTTLEVSYPPDPSADPAALFRSGLLRPADEFRPPFNNLSRFSDPARININTIFDQDVWEGLAKLYPPMDSVPFWNAVKASRRDFASGSTSDLNTSYPTRFGNPFRSSTSSKLMPIASMRKDGASSGLLRPGAGGTAPLFDATASAAYSDTNRNPYFRYSGVTRLSNMLTTHSNVYAVWMTIGFFEVEPNPGGADASHPDGFRLSREVGSDTGEIKRHRAFYMIDRSIPVAFEPGQDHNVEETVLLNRFIE